MEERGEASAAAPGPRRPDVGLEMALAGVCVATLGAVAVGSMVEDPPASPVLCPFRLATELPCPFCGLTRSLLAVGQGAWGRALEHHVLGPLFIVAAVVLFPLALRALVRRKPLGWPPFTLGTLSIVLAAGWAFNLSPGGP
ncbi:MAG: DUF2752 domain-containing protein [Thermoleophilaceae bacterium]|jgi:hypothetical protein